MNIDASLETGAQLAKRGQPGMRALDDPAMASKPVIALDAFASDAILDTTQLEMGAATRIVVALIGMQLSRPSPWLASSCRCPSPVLEEGRPKGCLCAVRTGCR